MNEEIIKNPVIIYGTSQQELTLRNVEPKLTIITPSSDTAEHLSDMRKFRDLHALKDHPSGRHVVVFIQDVSFMRGTDFRGKLTLFLGAKFNSLYAQV